MKKDYSKIIEYFKKNGFYTIPYLLKVFSYLPPSDRCVILNSLVSIFPDDVNVYDKLSMALLKNGEFNKAIQVLDKAYNNNYLNREIYQQLREKIEFLYNERGNNYGSSNNYNMSLSLIQTDMKQGLDLSWDDKSIKAYKEFCKIMIEFCEQGRVSKMS